MVPSTHVLWYTEGDKTYGMPGCRRCVDIMAAEMDNECPDHREPLVPAMETSK
jgi:hypothetical protein